LKKCFAHRGWSGKAPENTMAAVQLALEQPIVKGIEIDVRLSKDGIPVVIHDGKLGRTCNGKGLVSDYTFRELAQLDAGSWFSPQFAGEKIPSLEEVLLAIRGKKLLNIEIKTSWDFCPEIEKKVVEMVKKFDMEDQVYITSFNHEVIRKITELDSTVRTGLIIWGKPVLLEEQLEETGATILSINHEFLTPGFVSEVIERGITVIAWTVDDPVMIEKVSGFHPEIEICTNHPERILNIGKRRT